MRHLVCLFALLSLVAFTQRAYAFSDPEKFKLSALEGGGGGRFFTGSPADGYTCSVCHRGAPEPEVVLRGFPLDAYEPGKTYDVEVTWTEPTEPHALALEVITPDGKSAGQLELVEDSKLDARSYCEQDLTLFPASYLTEVAGRRIVGVTDCGATVLRFRFTAPDEPVLAFSMGMVRSDHEGDSQGDGALHVAHTLLRFGERPPPVVGKSSCSVSPTPGAALRLPWFVLALLTVGMTGRRLRKRDRRNTERGAAWNK